MRGQNKEGNWKKNRLTLFCIIPCVLGLFFFSYLEEMSNDSPIRTKIEITEAKHLDNSKQLISDVYELVNSKDNLYSEEIFSGEYVKIKFEKKLDKNSDITIYPIILSGNPRIEVYTSKSKNKIAEFTNLISNSSNKIYLTNISREDTFFLKVLEGSVKFDYITDPPGDLNNWKCSTTDRFDNAACWSLGSVPVAGEIIVFNGTGTGICNITNNTLPQDLESFTVEPSYTSSIFFNPLFAVGDWTGNSDGTQLWNVTNNINISGGTMKIYGDFHHYNITQVQGNRTNDGHGQEWWSLNGNITIGTGAIIDGAGLGFNATGPGFLSTGGATYGGLGANNLNNPYGNATAPTSLGSGGQDGPGGSAIKLQAEEIFVSGTINMSGLRGYGRRGSGGSIWLKANNITGTGTITVVGGSSTNSWRAGAGGRIRLEYTLDMNYTGRILLDGMSNTLGNNTDGTLTFTNNTWPRDWTLTGNIGLLGGDYGEGNVTNIRGNFNTNGYNVTIYGDCFHNGSSYMPYVCYNKTADGRGVWINASGNINITQGTKIIGEFGGFPKGLGPGTVYGSTLVGAYGGRLISNIAPPPYGNATGPVSLGSGGWYGLDSTKNGRGGSAIKLEAKSIDVTGEINMGGAPAGGAYTGGSGGSIWLKAENITGIGILDASGADVFGTSGAGSATGGRICLDYNNILDYSGTIDLASGIINSNARAHAGTLTFTNNTWPGNWTLTGNIGLLGGDYGWGNVTNVRGNFDTNGYNISIYGDCFGNNGTYKASICYNKTYDGRGVWLNVSGNITVTSTSKIDGSRLGFPIFFGPGTIMDPPGGGGTHGGHGSENPLALYGNETGPVSLGSGGDANSSTINWGGGGSAIKLESREIINLDGSIDMTPGLPEWICRAAGGSIWLKANNITGVGTLDSSGGSSTAGNRGGGGGRIALTSSDSISFNGIILNQGGTDTYNGADTGQGGDGGTVYLQATNSIYSSMNISVIGYNLSGNISFTNALTNLSGILNASGVNADGYIKINYTDCAWTDLSLGTFEPAITNQTNCTADINAPDLLVISPSNRTNTTDNQITINYTVSDTRRLRNCWYSYDNGITNTTIACGDNVTGITWSEGADTIILYATDNSNNLNYTIITFYLDTTSPEAQYANSTETNETISPLNQIRINITANDTTTGVNNITVNLYNSTGLFRTNVSLTSPYNITYSNIPAGMYYFNATITDYTNNKKIVSTRQINLTLPTLDLISPTNGTYFSNISLLVNFTTSYNTSVWYSIDSQSNVSLGRASRFNTTYGTHNLTIFSNNSNGQTSRSISFNSNQTTFNLSFGTYQNLGNTTNFNQYSNTELQNLSCVVIEKPPYGKIEFNENINFSNDLTPTDNTTDLDNYILISSDSISIDSANLPNLNKSATLSLYGLTFTNPRILRNGEVCSGDICTEESYIGGTLRFNVTAFSEYTAEETPTSSGTIGSSSGKTHSSTSSQKYIQTNVEEYKKIILPNTTSMESITITNIGKLETNFLTELKGLNDIVLLAESRLIIAPNKSKQLSFVIESPSSLGVYSGTLTIYTNYGKKSIPFTIEVRKKIIYLNTSIITKNITQYSNLEVQLDLTNSKPSESENVSLRYSIINETGVSLYEEVTSLIVGENKTLNIKIPTSNLITGDYLLDIRLDYSEGEVTQEISFKVEEEISNLSLYLGIGLAIIITIAIIALKKVYKRRKKKRTR